MHPAQGLLHSVHLLQRDDVPVALSQDPAHFAKPVGGLEVVGTAICLIRCGFVGVAGGQHIECDHADGMNVVEGHLVQMASGPVVDHIEFISRNRTATGWLERDDFGRKLCTDGGVLAANAFLFCTCKCMRFRDPCS